MNRLLPVVVQPKIQLSAPYGKPILIPFELILLAAVDSRVTDEQFMHICVTYKERQCGLSST